MNIKTNEKLVAGLRLGKQVLLLGLLGSMLISLTSCGFMKKQGRPLEELNNTQAEGQENYIVNAKDVLSIKVWEEPRVSGDVIVREDGKFSLPLINDIVAEGRTLKEISEEISTKLNEFVPSATVSITVVQTALVRYFLSGAFQRPGEFRSDGRITLLQSVATGGGFAPFADESNMTLIRRGKEGTELRYVFDYNRVVAGTEPNPVLKDGDVIAVK